MKHYWIHILNRRDWRNGTSAERREIEIRFSVARTLRAMRRNARITQTQLADRIGAAQRTISRIERASPRVSFDLAVRALIALAATDEEIAAAFDAGQRPEIARLRARGDVPFLLARDVAIKERASRIRKARS